MPEALGREVQMFEGANGTQTPDSWSVQGRRAAVWFKGLSGFAKFSLATLLYMLLVIAWGAYVRASGSGAGCGEHWPLCNGVIMPRSPRLATMIEFSHRLSSGLSLVLVLVQAVWAVLRYPRGGGVRQGAILSLIFLLLEAGLGAGLVLLQLVEKDASAMRAGAIGLHLTNTFLLLSVLAYTTYAATFGDDERLRLRAGPGRTAAVLTGLGLLVVMGISGAIVALGDTLFPATSLVAGMRADFLPTAHFLLRLRVVHPLVAVSGGGYLVAMAAFVRSRDPSPHTQWMSKAVMTAVGVQLSLGVFNLALLAPIWLQLLHLLAADLTWLSVIGLALCTLPKPAFTNQSAAQLATAASRPR